MNIMIRFSICTMTRHSEDQDKEIYLKIYIFYIYLNTGNK